MIKVKGILTDPFGKPLPKATIRITPTTNGTEVIAFLHGIITTGLDGSYDFDLKEGKFLLEFKQAKEYSDAAVIDVTANSGEVTLEHLIQAYKTCEAQEPVCPN